MQNGIGLILSLVFPRLLCRLSDHSVRLGLLVSCSIHEVGLCPRTPPFSSVRQFARRCSTTPEVLRDITSATASSLVSEGTWLSPLICSRLSAANCQCYHTLSAYLHSGRDTASRCFTLLNSHPPLKRKIYSQHKVSEASHGIGYGFWNLGREAPCCWYVGPSSHVTQAAVACLLLTIL